MKGYCKNWCVTIYDVDCNPRDWDHVGYCVWQKEKCPKTGKEHLQMFVQFTKRKRASSWPIKDKCWWQASRDPEAAIVYCKKDETRVEGPWEIGTFNPEVVDTPHSGGKRPGSVVDQYKQVSRLAKKRKFKEITDLYPSLAMRYHGGIKWMAEIHEPIRTEETKLIWIWGSSGSGKTTLMKQIARTYGTVYRKDSRTKWWDNYHGEDAVIVDEFKGGMYPTTICEIALNSHPMQVERKGGHHQFCSRVLIITSVKHPRWIYSDETGAWFEGLQRRCKGNTIFVWPTHEAFWTDWIPPQYMFTEPSMKDMGQSVKVSDVCKHKRVKTIDLQCHDEKVITLQDYD